MIKLREKDIEKLSILLQIPQYAIEKMSSMNLVNDALAVDMLVLNDYRKLKANKMYRSQQIVQAIMDEYQISKPKVEAAIYGKRKQIYSCNCCGRRIAKSEMVRNKGICDMCVSKSIKL